MNKELELSGQVPDDTWTYDDYVRVGLELGSLSAWAYGDLAAGVETHYAERTLEKFAADIGVGYGTLREYRRIAGLYPQNARRLDISWSACQALAAQKDRLQLVAGDPITLAAARELVAGRRKPRTPKASCPGGCGFTGSDDAVRQHGLDCPPFMAAFEAAGWPSGPGMLEAVAAHLQAAASDQRPPQDEPGDQAPAPVSGDVTAATLNVPETPAPATPPTDPPSPQQAPDSPAPPQAGTVPPGGHQHAAHDWVARCQCGHAVDISGKIAEQSASLAAGLAAYEELTAELAGVTAERDSLRAELEASRQQAAPDMVAPDTGSLFDSPASGVPVPSRPL